MHKASSPKRKAQPAEMREKILAESLTLVAQHGFDGVSIRDIAATVALTPAAIYYHFPDKDALYLEMVRGAFDRSLWSAMAEVEKSAPAWTRLEQFICQFTGLLAADRPLQRMMQWVLLDTNAARVQQLAENVFQPFYTVIADLLGEITPETETFPHVMSLMALMIFPFESITASQFLPGFISPAANPEKLSQNIINLLKNGLLQKQQ